MKIDKIIGKYLNEDDEKDSGGDKKEELRKKIEAMEAKRDKLSPEDKNSLDNLINAMKKKLEEM